MFFKVIDSILWGLLFIVAFPLTLPGVVKGIAILSYSFMMVMLWAFWWAVMFTIELEGQQINPVFTRTFITVACLMATVIVYLIFKDAWFKLSKVRKDENNE